jgi:hypothetical protein
MSIVRIIWNNPTGYQPTFTCSPGCVQGILYFLIMLTISFLLYSFAVMTEYNLSHYKWTVSSEADVLNRNVKNRFCLPMSRLFSCSVNILKLSVPVWVVPMWLTCCAEWLYYYLKKNKQKLDVSSEGPLSRVSSHMNTSRQGS